MLSSHLIACLLERRGLDKIIRITQLTDVGFHLEHTGFVLAVYSYKVRVLLVNITGVICVTAALYLHLSDRCTRSVSETCKREFSQIYSNVYFDSRIELNEIVSKIVETLIHYS